jgi:DNA-directed RNA polymerase II subunit RPB2
LTRQPPEGKQRDGGLRFGEMERDAIGAHGAAQFLKEKLLDVSDPFKINICDKCGKMAHKMKDNNFYICPKCKNTSNISEAVIPYVFKLLYQECSAINIDYALITENSLLNRGISG